jgi:sterol desaturase/sphingolipid hydroxylase (fatty acid hydroxylase superfamily)
MTSSFCLAAISLALRKNKILGMTSISLVILATLLGGPRATEQFPLAGDLYLGLDFFLLNLIFLGTVFVPIERIWGDRNQHIFRDDWREDLLYFLIGSLLVQGVTFLSLTPSLTILQHTSGASFRAYVASQPIILQFLEIMFLTDLVQYWVHRLFHCVPWLWRFHAIHHSAPKMDWLAGSRMHLIEVICLRSTTVMPMTVLGFAQPALYAYLVVVYFWSAMVHSNVKVDFGRWESWIVTPRFHHWHHGIEREAIDINFAVHFPILDRLFGTLYLPEKRWPSGYGVLHPHIPRGYWKQWWFPIISLFKKPQSPAATNNSNQIQPNPVEESVNQ